MIVFRRPVWRQATYRAEAGSLIDGYNEQFEQKQARNNPYGSLEEKEHPELYRVFEASWYEGYAAGFLSKISLRQGRATPDELSLNTVDQIKIGKVFEGL